MIQIDNHEELALNSTIPYLLQFPEFYNLVKLSGKRYQEIEDIAWQLLYDLDYTTANGVWLDYIGNKVGQDRVYTPKPANAFTFGGLTAEGFGAGKFKGTSSIRSTKVARSDASFRNAIKAKIIQNNTDTSLDELREACKLLFNAKLVRITENYPASISSIKLYGSALLETADANAWIKNALPAGVSLSNVTFHRFYNLFKNNAFITYDKILPERDDFELSFVVQLDTAPTEAIQLFSQNTTFASEFVSAICFYDPEDGIVFRTAPAQYNDNSSGYTYYTDGQDNHYTDSDATISLNGGHLVVNEAIPIRITREGNTWALYVNDVFVDGDEEEHNIIVGEDVKFYLGTSEGEFYNSGSIYNLYLKNNTLDEVLINDPLRNSTTGINNGVKFI